MQISKKHGVALEYIRKARERPTEVPVSLPFLLKSDRTTRERMDMTTRLCVLDTDRPEVLAQHLMERLLEDVDVVPTKQGFLWMKERSGVLLLHTGLSLFYMVSDRRERKNYPGKMVRAFTLTALSDKNGGAVATEIGFYDEETGGILTLPTSKSAYDGDASYMTGAFFALLLRFLFFRDFVEIEQVEIHQKNQRAKLGGEKYLNSSPVKVRVIDSRWFRSVSVVGGSRVRGHLRLQACGPRHTERKVVWVKAHDRSGYTRKAGKEADGK